MTVIANLQARNEAKELRLLFEVSRLLIDLGKRPEERLREVLAALARHTALLWGAIALIDEAGLETAAEIGPAPGGAGPLERFGRGALSLAAETGRTAVKLKVSEEPLFLTQANLRELGKERLACLYVPINSGASRLGVLAADRLFAESVPLEEDLRLLTILAGLLAEALGAHRAGELKRQTALADNRRLKELLGLDPPPLLGRSASMLATHDLLRQLASNDFNVLITGESGTGKELAARHLHALSSRSGGPFLKIACAAQDGGETAAALFGSPATGAEGRLRPAQNGTVYLAGLENLPPDCQAKLLALLNGASFAQVGGVGQSRLAARLVSATEFSKNYLIEQSGFRPDLAARLSQFSLSLPPLRGRREDLPVITDHFLKLWSHECGLKPAGLTPEARLSLANYNWPGNLRELNLALGRGVVLARGGFIGPEHLAGLTPLSELSEQGEAKLPQALSGLERQMVVEALEAESGHMARAAARLGLSKRVMGLRMRKYGLDFKNFRRPARPKA